MSTPDAKPDAPPATPPATFGGPLEYCSCCTPPKRLAYASPGEHVDDDTGQVLSAAQVLAWRHSPMGAYPGCCP